MTEFKQGDVVRLMKGCGTFYKEGARAVLVLKAHKEPDTNTQLWQADFDLAITPNPKGSYKVNKVTGDSVWMVDESHLELA